VIAGPPTVPNLIEPPLTDPWMASVPPGLRLIVPARFDPDCFQVRLNVPENAPPYCPDHLPPTVLLLDEEDAGLVADLAAGGLTELVFAALDDPLLPQPAARSAAADRVEVTISRRECIRFSS
jgi:hypothetical protein